MAGRKSVRTRGKLQLSKYFQEFNEGDCVAVVSEPAVQFSFPERLHGRTGFVTGKKGKAYIVTINDINKKKDFLIEPIHLKKIMLK